MIPSLPKTNGTNSQK